MSRPQLAISILISRNYDGVMRCLDSVCPIMDKLPSELILTDTGCGEKVRELIEEYSSKYSGTIIDFEWIKDFSAARNVGVEAAKKDGAEWFMYIDDDEWFDDVNELVEFFDSGKCNNYNVAYYVQRNYLDMKGEKYVDHNVDRIIRITDELHFEHRIHEAYAGVDIGTKAQLKTFVHHYGYVSDNGEGKALKSKRNRELIRLEVSEHPEDMRMQHQLVMDYYSTHDYDKAINVALDAIKIKSESQYWDAIHTDMLYCYQAKKDWEGLISQGEKFLEHNLFPYDEFGVWQYLINAYYMLKRYDDICEVAYKVIDAYSVYKNSPDMYDQNQLLRNEFWVTDNILREFLYIIEAAAMTNNTDIIALFDNLSERICSDADSDIYIIKYCQALCNDYKLSHISDYIDDLDEYDRLKKVLLLMTSYADYMMYYCEYKYGDRLADMTEDALASMERLAWIIQDLIDNVDKENVSGAIADVRIMSELVPKWQEAIAYLPTYIQLVCR